MVLADFRLYTVSNAGEEKGTGDDEENAVHKGPVKDSTVSTAENGVLWESHQGDNNSIYDQRNTGGFQAAPFIFGQLSVHIKRSNAAFRRIVFPETWLNDLKSDKEGDQRKDERTGESEEIVAGEREDYGRINDLCGILRIAKTDDFDYTDYWA